MANSLDLSLEQIKVRVLQMKAKDEDDKKDLLNYADYLNQIDSTGNIDIRKLRKEIRDASTAKMDVLEAIDTAATNNIKSDIEIDNKINGKIRGLIPSDDRE